MISLLPLFSLLFGSTTVHVTDAKDNDGGFQQRQTRRRIGEGQRRQSAEEEDQASTRDTFYDMSLSTKEEKLDMIRKAYWFAHYGDSVNWDMQRDKFVQTVRKSQLQSRNVDATADSTAAAAAAANVDAYKEQLDTLHGNNGNNGASFGTFDGETIENDPRVKTPPSHRRRLQGNNIDGDVFDGYEYASGGCPSSDPSGIPCAPDNLAALCNKYDREQGSFRACLAACSPAFCCIHDAPPENFFAENCNMDEKCAQYSYCYIAWWKLEDTVGPALYLRIDQDDEFYDLEAEDTESYLNELGLLTPLLLHHFDDINAVIVDGTVGNEFDAENVFLNESYWVYPVTGKVDVDDP